MPFNPATRTVRNTSDLKRIRALPRRALTKAKAERAAERLTALFALKPGAKLRPWQGGALEEIARCHDKIPGAFLSLPVGTGKTIVAELAPAMLPKLKGRWVLIIPASLKKKTRKDRREMVGVWKTAATPPRIITKEALQRESGAKLLEEIDPVGIIIDESDELAHLERGAASRVDRFVEKKRAAGRVVVVVCMTGTPTRRSIMGVWHFLRWCLSSPQHDGAPVPAARIDAEAWAAALDDASPRGGFRPKPGALGETLKEAREWYLDRLASTPGVVLVDEDSAANIPLHIHFRRVPEAKEITKAFGQLYTQWESPGGEQATDGLSILRLDQHLGCGLYTYFDPPPPKPWKEARRAFAKKVRAKIASSRHSRRPLDTEAQVVRAYPGDPAIAAWIGVKDTYRPEHHAHTAWLSTSVLEDVATWVAEQGTKPTIVWCGSVEFGRRLAKLMGCPYYGPKGLELRTGRSLTDATVKRDRHIVCSWHANKRGFNLQPWRDNAIVMPPQSAKYLEQIIGRGHRGGQTKPVHFTVFVTSGGTLDSLDAALGEAAFCRDTARNTQKILRANIDQYPRLPEKIRWLRKEEE